MNKKRTFTQQEKLSILREASENGVKTTLEKHGIYTATYYSWRKKFNTMGESGLVHGMTPAHLKRIRELEKENQQLKELVAEKELVVRMHEAVKKKWALEKKSKR
jgi:putative transposase